jgi:coproporphyrinogen III oxidase-like Fe-S oxidoreductase
MVKAGCFRADIGMSTLNPKIQKLYDNIFINEYIKNLVKVSLAGIWTHINIISGLPYQYSVDQEIKILIKYIKHIDGVSLYPYLAFRDARLEENYDKFNLKRVEEKIITENKIFIMPFMEKDFKGSVEQRKKMFLESYVKLYNFFLKNKIVPQKLSFNLLGYLYDQLGFARKEEIKEIVNKAGD